MQTIATDSRARPAGSPNAYFNGETARFDVDPMPPRCSGTSWEFEAVDLDHTFVKKPNGDRKFSCKWCGSEMLGGPSRIREHFVYNEHTKRHYALCTSTSKSAVAFKARCEEENKRLQEKRKRDMERLFGEQQVSWCKKFKKEQDAAAAAGVQYKMGQADQAKLAAITAADLNEQWCRALVACGIPAHVLRHVEFAKALKMTAQYGDANWTPPTAKALMTTHLDRLDKEVRTAYILLTLK